MVLRSARQARRLCTMDSRKTVQRTIPRVVSIPVAALTFALGTHNLSLRAEQGCEGNRVRLGPSETPPDPGRAGLPWSLSIVSAPLRLTFTLYTHPRIKVGATLRP